MHWSCAHFLECPSPYRPVRRCSCRRLHHPAVGMGGALCGDPGSTREEAMGSVLLLRGNDYGVEISGGSQLLPWQGGLLQVRPQGDLRCHRYESSLFLEAVGAGDPTVCGKTVYTAAAHQRVVHIVVPQDVTLVQSSPAQSSGRLHRDGRPEAVFRCSLHLRRMHWQAVAANMPSYVSY
jgi:hypothetical protein